MASALGGHQNQQVCAAWEYKPGTCTLMHGILRSEVVTRLQNASRDFKYWLLRAVFLRNLLRTLFFTSFRLLQTHLNQQNISVRIALYPKTIGRGFDLRLGRLRSLLQQLASACFRQKSGQLPSKERFSTRHDTQEHGLG